MPGYGGGVLDGSQPYWGNAPAVPSDPTMLSLAGGQFPVEQGGIPFGIAASGLAGGVGGPGGWGGPAATANYAGLMDNPSGYPAASRAGGLFPDLFQAGRRPTGWFTMEDYYGRAPDYTETDTGARDARDARGAGGVGAGRG